MRVAFMPLGEHQGRAAIVVDQFPVILTRSSRGSLTPEACTVSPLHCEIDVEDGVLVVRDLGSKHGTYVNGARVRHASLWPGSKLTVGVNSFFVCYSLANDRWTSVVTAACGELGSLPAGPGLSTGID